jgi:O-antigen/teichoic acid export membrane protein
MAGDSRRRMSVTRRIMFGAVANWFSRGLTIVLGLVLMPVLFGHLPKEELGVWLLLGQSWAALGILDLGFGVTLTRRIALTKGKSGGDPDTPLTEETLREIADLTESGRRIYQVMSAGVFVVAWLAGFFYLRNLSLHDVSHTTVWIAWTILCASQACVVWAAVWTCLLQGVGYVGWDAIIASFVAAATLIAQIIGVVSGGRLIVLATIATGGALLQRALIRWMARRRRPELFSLRGRWNPEVLRGMPGLAFRAWLTAVGMVLVFNTDQFFIAGLQGAAAIPAYRAAYLIILNLNMVAVSFGAASAVFVSHLWQAQELTALHHLVQRNVRLGLSIILCGSACVLSLGPRLFDVWIGPGKFIGYPVLIVFIASLTLETQNFIVVTSSRATEDEAFAGSTMLAGILKLLLSWALMFRFGLLGIATGTLLSGLVTNDWYMVSRGLGRLRMSLREHIKGVVMPSITLFAVTLLCNLIVVNLGRSNTAIVQVLLAVIVSGIVFTLGSWLLVLSKSERDRLLTVVGFSRATRISPSKT